MAMASWFESLLGVVASCSASPAMALVRASPQRSGMIDVELDESPRCYRKRRRQSDQQPLSVSPIQAKMSAKTEEGRGSSKPIKWGARRKKQRSGLRSAKDHSLKVPRDMQGRWSKERFENAQESLVGILHAKKAVPGAPVLRHVFRDEARKYIGDTGLLDHLLKHMTDRVVAPGERFRRRHNAEGSMEYWLEDASFMAIRKSANIMDPWWTPPSGWKSGDPLPVSDSEVIKILEEEVRSLKNELQQAILSKDEVCEALPIASEEPRYYIENTKDECLEEHLVEGLDVTERLEESMVERLEKLERFEGNTEERLEKLEGWFSGTRTERNAVERLEKLEADVYKIIQESKLRHEMGIVEKLTLESQLANMWKAVTMMQEKLSSIESDNSRCHQPQPRRAFVSCSNKRPPSDEAPEVQETHAFKLCRPAGTFVMPAMARSSKPFRVEDESNSAEVTANSGVGDAENVFFNVAVQALQDGLNPGASWPELRASPTLLHA